MALFAVRRTVLGFVLEDRDLLFLALLLNFAGDLSTLDIRRTDFCCSVGIEHNGVEDYFFTG